MSPRSKQRVVSMAPCSLCRTNALEISEAVQLIERLREGLEAIRASNLERGHAAADELLIEINRWEIPF